jgi:hypothetical protein
MHRFVGWTGHVLIGCAIAVSCARSADGPERAAQQFYAAINDGEYSEAMELLGSDVLRSLEDPEPGREPESFADWAQRATKNGTVRNVRAITRHVDDVTASVELEIDFADGETTLETLRLVLEGDQWKIGRLR